MPRPLDRSRASWRLVLPLLALALGCKTAVQVKKDPGVAVGGAWAIAVYPPYFRFPVSGAEAYLRGVALAEDVSRRTDKLVFGPGEFQIENWDDEDVKRATNVIEALPISTTRKPEGIFAIRTRIEQRTGATSRAYASSDGSSGQQVESSVTYFVRMQLLSVATRDVVIELEADAAAAGAILQPGADPLPEVTKLTALLLGEVLERAGWELAAPRPVLLTGLPAPKPAITFSAAGRPSLEEEWKSLDALDQEAAMLRVLQRLDPKIDRARGRRLKSAPHGVVVTSADGALAKAGVQAGDLLLTVGGERFSGRHVLDRHLTTGRPVKLTLDRDGAPLEVVVEPAP